MKGKKKAGSRLVASLLSAAVLTGTTAASFATAPVQAAGEDNDYYQALALSLYFFDANACGPDVDENPLTWRGNCHTYDEFPGGYHDAGDHIKFNLTMGFAGSSLAMAEYLNPGVFEKAGCKDHLVAILKRNADYLMSTTIMSGDSVEKIAHVVSDGNVDHSDWRSPEIQTYPRTTFYLTAGENNSAVCGEMAAALAGTAYVVQDSDPAYAAECVKYAKALVAFGEDHVGNNTSGLGGFYDTDAQYQDEISLAKAWLWILGEGDKPTITPMGGGQYSNGVGYDGYRYTWDKVWQGYAAMMYKATGDSMWSDELKYEIGNQGGLSVGAYNGNGWGASRYNCALQMSGYAVANGDANDQYALAGKWQMDYILGNNPTGYSFLIGYGDKYPTHIHHRAANPGDSSESVNGDPAKNTEAKYTLYGALVGGVDGGGSYDDNSNSYQYTEPALDYNGCFVLACAGLANLYGGSDAGATEIIGQAGEITYPYDFGTGSGSGSVKPTEAPGENPTEESTEVSGQPTEAPTEAPTQAPTEAPTQPPAGNKQPADVNKDTDTQYSVDVKGGISVDVHAKSNSGDWESNGRYTFYDESGNQLDQGDWKADCQTGSFDLNWDIPDNAAKLVIEFWWPTTASVESAEVTFPGSSVDPTEAPTQAPTEAPTQAPTEAPTQAPTEAPTQAPTEAPTSNQGGSVTLYGDLDGDGKVTLSDVILLNKYMMGVDGVTLGEPAHSNADANGDGQLTSEDSLQILRCVVELISTSDFPVKD